MKKSLSIIAISSLLVSTCTHAENSQKIDEGKPAVTESTFLTKKDNWYNGLSIGAGFGLAPVLNVSYRLNNYVEAYASIGGETNLKQTVHTDDNKYKVKFSFSQNVIGLSVHPFKGSFAIDGGFGSAKFKASFSHMKTPKYAYTTLSGKAGWDGTYPFVALGLGSIAGKEKGLSFYTRFGVFFVGDASVSLTDDNNLTPRQDLDNEETKLKNKLDNVPVIPYGLIGLSYTF